MAVEDGAVLGLLLGRLNQATGRCSGPESLVPEVLKLYETLRKSRITTNVAGAVSNQYWYHRSDGPEQEERDQLLAAAGKGVKSKWNLTDEDYQMDLLGFDVIKDSEDAFDRWVQKRTMAHI